VATWEIVASFMKKRGGFPCLPDLPELLKVIRRAPTKGKGEGEGEGERGNKGISNLEMVTS